jgi:hypothetical protein
MPRTLAPLRRLWLKLGHLMSIVVSQIILALMYVLAIVVTGVLIRLFGKDLLSLKPSPKRRHIGSNETRLAPSSNRSRTSSDRDRSGASSDVDGGLNIMTGAQTSLTEAEFGQDNARSWNFRILPR